MRQHPLLQEFIKWVRESRYASKPGSNKASSRVRSLGQQMDGESLIAEANADCLEKRPLWYLNTFEKENILNTQEETPWWQHKPFWIRLRTAEGPHSGKLNTHTFSLNGHTYYTYYINQSTANKIRIWHRMHNMYTYLPDWYPLI